MDILDGAIFWSTLGAKCTKGNCCILVFRSWEILVVLRALGVQKLFYYLLVHFYIWNDIILWGY